MSILEWLGLSSEKQASDKARDPSRDAEAVRRISAALELLDERKARWIAAFAYLLGRVAHADLEISADESAQMEEIVRKIGGIPDEQAVLVTEIAKSQNRLFGGTQNFLVARDFKELSTSEERHRLIDALFAVSAADDSISNQEESEIKKISTELGLTLEDFVAARSEWSDKRAVLQALESSRQRQ